MSHEKYTYCGVLQGTRCGTTASLLFSLKISGTHHMNSILHFNGYVDKLERDIDNSQAMNLEDESWLNGGSVYLPTFRGDQN